MLCSIGITALSDVLLLGIYMKVRLLLLLLLLLLVLLLLQLWEAGCSLRLHIHTCAFELLSICNHSLQDLYTQNCVHQQSAASEHVSEACVEYHLKPSMPVCVAGHCGTVQWAVSSCRDAGCCQGRSALQRYVGNGKPAA